MGLYFQTWHFDFGATNIRFMGSHTIEGFRNLPFRILDDILRRKDLVILSEQENAFALIRWSENSASWNEGYNLSYSAWAKANHLLGHTISQIRATNKLKLLENGLLEISIQGS